MLVVIYISDLVNIMYYSLKLEQKLPLIYFLLQFDEALNQIDPLESLRKLVDPRLREDYPIDSVLKVGSISFGKFFFPLFSICVIYKKKKKKTCLYGIAFQINICKRC